MTNLDGELDWPWTRHHLRIGARLARLDLPESARRPYKSISNGYMAMGPPVASYHHQVWINRMLARVEVLPIHRLPHISVPHELVVGGDVGEVVGILEVRLRECLGLLVRGSMGHGIEVVHLWHRRLIGMRLQERNKVLIKGSS